MANKSSNCQNCGSPVVFTSHWKSSCEYCGTERSYDIEEWTLSRDNDKNKPLGPCPRCKTTQWRTLHLDNEDGILHRCETCLGLFVNTFLLKSLIQHKDEDPSLEDKVLLNFLAEDTPFKEERIQYLSCPTCTQQMSRKNYGKSSGVIIDSCLDHGTWLDSGELGKIKDWTKAGGKARQIRIETDSLKRERNTAARAKYSEATTLNTTTYSNRKTTELDIGVLLSRIAGWFIN